MNLSTLTTLAEKLKAKAAIITTSISTIAAIGGAVIYVENNYAHASDIKEIVKGQQQIIQIQQVSQRQQLMFQLEYYDDRIRRLTAELTQAEELTQMAQSRGTAQTTRQVARASTRSVNEIKNDLEDTKRRRELTRQSLTTAQ